MKKQISILLACASAAAGVLLSSCSADEPLYEGEGVLKMKMVVNSTLTRAESDQQELADKCTVYVSGSKGLLYKYQGLDNLPSDLYLKAGSYVAEAWTGDSVSASFDAKFYKAYEPFTITKGDVKNVVLNCKIANVVASINPEPIIAEALKDYKVTVSHSRGSLEFTEENAASAHGYFMLPNADKDLKWTITGKTEDDKDFTKSGVIENVQRAHEYVLNIRYTPSSTTQGGGVITVTVDDTELLIEDTIELTGAPAISGVGFDIDQTLAGEQGSFGKKSLYVEAFDGLSSLLVSTQTPEAFGFPQGDFDFITMTDQARTNLENAGVTCAYTVADGKAKARIVMEDKVFNNLANGEYELRFTATDLAGKIRNRTLKIMVSDASVVIRETEWNEVYATRATFHGEIMKDDATNPGFRYRKAGSADWKFVAAAAATERPGRRASSKVYSAEVTGLEPGTRYEYKAVCDGYENPQIATITTESIFTIPNGGFEGWAKNSKGAWIPSASGNVEFWDSGNHGSIKMKKNVTEPVEAPIHSGSKAARLKSQFVGLGTVGRFAAGNLFAGTYDKTDGMDGELTFGRTYNGSRPVKLRGYAYYHPGTVDNESSDAGLSKGQTDIGTIYIALTTQSVPVKTKTRELFDPNAQYVIAYGALDMTSDFGSSTALKEFEITLEYNKARELLSRPTHIVIVASASKYGDYFTGSSESVLVVDDLELVY